MLIGVIADKFTAASDIANTLAKGVEPEGELATGQFPGTPAGSVPPDVDARVISLKSRYSSSRKGGENSQPSVFEQSRKFSLLSNPWLSHVRTSDARRFLANFSMILWGACLGLATDSQSDCTNPI